MKPRLGGKNYGLDERNPSNNAMQRRVASRRPLIASPSRLRGHTRVLGALRKLLGRSELATSGPIKISAEPRLTCCGGSSQKD